MAEDVRSRLTLIVSGSRAPSFLRPAGGKTEPYLTFWWGVTVCSFGLKRPVLAENLVIHMKMAAMQELSGVEVKQPTLQEILAFKGAARANPAPESTTRELAERKSRSVEGASKLGSPTDVDEGNPPSANYAKTPCCLHHG